MNLQANVFGKLDLTGLMVRLMRGPVSERQPEHDDHHIDFGDLIVDQEYQDVNSKANLPFEGERGVVYRTLDDMEQYIWKGSAVGYSLFKPYEEGNAERPPKYCGMVEDSSCTFSGNGDPRTRLANALRALMDDTRSIENNSLMSFEQFTGFGDIKIQQKDFGLKGTEAVYNAFVHRHHTALIKLVRDHMRGNTRSEFYLAVENLGAVARYDAEDRRVVLEFTGTLNETHPYEVRLATRVYKVFV